MTPESRTPDRIRGRGRLLVVLAALVAVLIQALVIQTHTHSSFIGAAAFERAIDHGQPGHTHVSAQHESTGCITCIAFASAGVSLAPDTITLGVVSRAASDAATLAIRRAPRALTHSWQSRAPPTLF